MGISIPRRYRNICADAAWARRLTKVHTAWPRTRVSDRRRWKELDCANSSDALLMNIFCYRRVFAMPALASLLGVEPGATPEFGCRPCIPLRNGKKDRTEIDMRLGGLLVEAKLTESDFQTAPSRMIERYRDFEEVFDGAVLARDGEIASYQLVRGVLAAHSTGYEFAVFCDRRRPDLIEHWYSVMSAVKSYSLRCRLKLLTWQEIAVVLPKALRVFLATKYGI